MPPEQFVALALGIVSAVCGVILAVFRGAFDAWRKGELISRSVHDSIVKLVTDELAALRVTNAALRDDLRDSGAEIKRLNAILSDRAK